jgi:hypothetical protein
MASGVFNIYKANLMNKLIDMEADTLKVMLLDDNHIFTAADNVIGDVSANEITGTGYDVGGKALVSGAVTQGATTKFDANDLTWTISTFSAWHAVIYDTTVSDNLLVSVDFTSEQAVSAGTFTIQWHEDGIITLS